MATFSAQQRTKEIGIRKVLGATATSIVTLFNKDFLKLVIAFATVSWQSIKTVIANPVNSLRDE